MQRRRDHQAPKVDPCDICGDVGFGEVIVTCFQCKVIREHVYCMRINLTEVPDYWLCETCESKNVTTSSCIVKQDSFFEQAVKQDSGLLDSRRQRSARTGPTGKVKYLHADEVIKLYSCNLNMIPTPSSSTLPMTKKPIPRSSARPVTGRSRVASRSVAPKISSVTMKPNTNTEPVAHGMFPRNGVQKNPMPDQHTSPPRRRRGRPRKEHTLVSERQVSSPILDRKIQALKFQTLNLQIEKLTKDSPATESSPAVAPKRGRGRPRKEHRLVSERQVSSPILDRELQPLKIQTLNLHIEKPTKDLSATQSSPVVVSDPVAECNQFNMEESKNQSIHEDFYHELKYLPSSVRAWSGQFQILQNAASGELYDGFEAQPPCIVNRKAYKLSNKFPSVLQLESLSALNYFTDVFQNCSPRLQDIALYFFPSDNNESSKENLNRLLKFMNDENSIMRSVIDGVELLVFTSHQLNEHSRGAVAAVYEGCFLWGVFRSNKPPDMDPTDVDMDVDMMGGNDVVGRVDNVLNDNLRSPSQFPLEGTTLQNIASIKVEEKTLTPSSNLNLNGGDKSILSYGSPVEKYCEVLDILDVPPGFEAHGFGAVKPSNMDVDMMGGNDVVGSIDNVLNDNLKMLLGVFRSNKSVPPDMDPVDGDDDMDIDMMGGNDVGRIDNVLNDNLKSPSQFPLEGTTLQSTASMKVEEKTLTPPSNLNLNGSDKSILSEDRKKIKLKDSSDPSSGSPVEKIKFCLKHRKVRDIPHVPPCFQAHRSAAAVKPSNIKK